MYRITESLHCTPGTNMTLCLLYFTNKKKEACTSMRQSLPLPSCAASEKSLKLFDSQLSLC